MPCVKPIRISPNPLLSLFVNLFEMYRKIDLPGAYTESSPNIFSWNINFLVYLFGYPHITPRESYSSIGLLGPYLIQSKLFEEISIVSFKVCSVNSFNSKSHQPLNCKEDSKPSPVFSCRNLLSECHRTGRGTIVCGQEVPASSIHLKAVIKLIPKHSIRLLFDTTTELITTIDDGPRWWPRWLNMALQRVEGVSASAGMT